MQFEHVLCLGLLRINQWKRNILHGAQARVQNVTPCNALPPFALFAETSNERIPNVTPHVPCNALPPGTIPMDFAAWSAGNLKSFDGFMAEVDGLLLA